MTTDKERINNALEMVEMMIIEYEFDLTVLGSYFSVNALIVI